MNWYEAIAAWFITCAVWLGWAQFARLRVPVKVYLGVLWTLAVLLVGAIVVAVEVMRWR